MGWWRKKKPKPKPNLDRGAMLLEDLIECCDGKSNPIKFFSAHQILKATNNFSQSNQVSELFDFDYKWYSGKDENHPMILIRKALFMSYRHGRFCRDLAISSMVSGHKNFMKLVGCCLEFEDPVIVYNGIKKHYKLNNIINRQPWNRRMKIAEDIATALAYLHTAFPRPFVYMKKWQYGEVPREMLSNLDLWNGFVAYWKQDSTQEDSAIHSTNRNNDRKGKGKATHNLGAVIKATRRLQFLHQDGVEPSHFRLLKDAHTNIKTGEIQDPVAREICANVEMQAEEYLKSQPMVEGTPSCTEVPIDVLTEFVYQSRGHVFCLPEGFQSLASSRYTVDADLRAELSEKTTQIEGLQIKIPTLEDNNREIETRMQVKVQTEV